MKFEIVRLQDNDGTWENFEADWKSQCEAHKEDFSEYASGTFSVVRDLAKTEEESAGVFAFRVDGKHASFCQLNRAFLPGYKTPVLRARHMTHCPDLDFGDHPIDAYIESLACAFGGVLAASDHREGFIAKHINLHLRSPTDRQFFKMLGKGLNDEAEFESVQTRGSWLYVTKA
jgi:hypothetical protein